MSACPEMEAFLAERASGEIPAEDAARVAAHLEGCAACRDELSAWEETFSMARLPPAEARTTDLDVSTFTAFQRRRRRRVTGLTLGAGFVAAAVAAGVVLAPALLTLRSLPQQPHAAAIAAAAAHAVTDDAARTRSTAGSASEELAPEDVALAALDEVVSR
jgi:predicted anti-sigma-YlaC factor YlaD